MGYEPIFCIGQNIGVNRGRLLSGIHEGNLGLCSLFSDAWPRVLEVVLPTNQVVRLLDIENDVHGCLAAVQRVELALENGFRDTQRQRPSN